MACIFAACMYTGAAVPLDAASARWLDARYPEDADARTAALMQHITLPAHALAGAPAAGNDEKGADGEVISASATRTWLRAVEACADWACWALEQG